MALQRPLSQSLTQSYVNVLTQDHCNAGLKATGRFGGRAPMWYYKCIHNGFLFGAHCSTPMLRMQESVLFIARFLVGRNVTFALRYVCVTLRSLMCRKYGKMASEWLSCDTTAITWGIVPRNKYNFTDIPLKHVSIGCRRMCSTLPFRLHSMWWHRRYTLQLNQSQTLPLYDPPPPPEYFHQRRSLILSTVEAKYCVFITRL